MLAVLASLIAGLALWDKSGGRGVVLLAGAVMFYLAVNLCSYSWEMPGRWQVFSVGIILVLMCSWRVHAVLSVPAEPNRTLTDITGTVSSLRTWGRIYVATIDAEDGKRYVTRMQFAEMMEGTRIRFSGITQKFRQSSGGFNEARFWKARGAKSWINLRDVHELPERFSLPLMRCRLSRSLAVYMPRISPCGMAGRTFRRTQQEAPAMGNESSSGCVRVSRGNCCSDCGVSLRRQCVNPVRDTLDVHTAYGCRSQCNAGRADVSGGIDGKAYRQEG